MAYDIYKDPNIVQDLGGGKFKRKDGQIVDKYGIVIKQGETLASTPRPKINLFDFQTKVPGTNTNKIVPSTTAIATSVKPKNNVYTPSSPASMLKPVIKPTPSTGIPGISQASASEKDLLQTYFDDTTQDVSNKETFVQMLKDGVPSTEIEDILINQIKYNPQPIQEEKVDINKLGLLDEAGQRLSNLGTKLGDRAGETARSWQRKHSDNPFISSAQSFGTALNTVGNVIGGAFDIGGEGIAYITPDIIKEGLSGAGKEIWGHLSNKSQDKVINAIKAGGEAYTNFKKENPFLADALEGAGNIASVVPIGKGTQIGAKAIVKGTDKLSNTTKNLFKKTDKTKLAQDKLFKAQNPTINKLSKDRNLGQLKAKSDLANATIIQRGHKPVDTETRVDSHIKTMKEVWKDVETKIKTAGVDTQIDFKQVGSSIRSYLDENPALLQISPDDYNKLLKLSDDYNKIGKKDVIFAENAKQIINAKVKNWGEGEKLSEAVSNGLKRATADIGQQLDLKLSSIPGEFQHLKQTYGALAETLEDVIKTNVVNQRKKGFGLTESYSRIEGLGDIAEGLFSLLGDPKNVIPKVIKGGAKLLIGKKLQQLKDPDILIKDAFEILEQSKKSKTPFENTTAKIKTPTSTPNTGNNSRLDTKLKPKKDKTGQATNIILSDKEKVIRPKEVTKTDKGFIARRENIERTQDENYLNILERQKEGPGKAVKLGDIALKNPKYQEAMQKAKAIEYRIRQEATDKYLKGINISQYDKSLLDAFKPLKEGLDKLRTTKGYDKYTKVEDLAKRYKSFQRFVDEAQTYINKYNLDKSVQEIFDDMMDMKPGTITKPTK